MKASLRALLSGVIDYAGMFPPAKLPLDEAFRNYLRYRTEPESWMLGRFICPSDRLSELARFEQEIGTANPPVVISALGRGSGQDSTEFESSVKADLAAIEIFQRKMGPGAVVDTLELRLTAEQLSAASVIMHTMHSPDRSVIPYFELAWRTATSPDWRRAAILEWEEKAQSLAMSLALANRHEETSPRGLSRPAGFKLRCGGVEKLAFPSPNVVARVVANCRDHCVPLKFTAGLHHPTRRFDSALDTYMHGFLNVYVVSVFAHARGLERQIIHEILLGENAEDFRFDDDALHWRDHMATVAEIEAAREQFVKSFGSCSFDEPRDDLRSLQLL